MESVHSPPVFPLAILITVGHETTSRTTFELGHLNNNEELENIKTNKTYHLYLILPHHQLSTFPLTIVALKGWTETSARCHL